MELNEYQRRALKTRVYKDADRLIYPVLKLAGEAGEVAEKLAKWLRDDGGDLRDVGSMSQTKREELTKEIGDVLWYLAAIASDLGLTLDEVACGNLAKLADRQSRGVIGGGGDER